MSAFFRSHSHDLRQLSASCELAPVCVINSVTRWVVSIVPVPVPLPLRVLRCCPPPQPPTGSTDDDDEDRCFCRPPGGSLLRRCSCCCCCWRCRLLPSQHPPQQQQQQHLVHPPTPEQQRLSEAAAVDLATTTTTFPASQHGRIFPESLLVVFFFFVWVRIFGDAPATVRSTAQIDAAVRFKSSSTLVLLQSGAILNFWVCFRFLQITFSLNHFSAPLQFCSRLLLG